MSVQSPTPVGASVVALPHALPPEKEAPKQQHQVEPPPRLPSRPNLTRQFGDEPVSDEYVVELPRRTEPSPGPTYSALGRTKSA